MVIDGRITVNGKVMRDLPILIDPERDKILVDGETIKLAEKKRGGRGGSGRDASPGGPRIYIMLNKPKGVYATNVAQGTQMRAIDLLPEDLPGRVYPVGRLDVESKGLLLMTNDGELTNRLTHPRYGISKTYRAAVDGAPSPATIAEIEKGIWIVDPRSGETQRSGHCEVKVVKRLRERSVLDITIREGRSIPIRRVLAKLGHKVRDLTRTKVGPLTLENLKPGFFRELTPKEVKTLHHLTEKAAPAPKKPGRPVAEVEFIDMGDDEEE